MNQLALSTTSADRQKGGHDSGNNPSSIGIGSDGEECAEKDEHDMFSASLMRRAARV